MQTEDPTSGYSDLLRQFKERTRTSTDISKLRILFWFEDYDLVADEELTGCSIVVAIYNRRSRKWRHELTPGSPARELVQDFCEKNGAENVPGQLNLRLGLLL